MRAYLRSVMVATIALGAAGVVNAQSSPFAWLTGGDPLEDSPIDLQFQIEGDDGALERRIRNGSLLTSALQEGRITGQDMLAAARGDYARILGVLYDQGYYSVLVNITLDGVEAASIAPLDAPPEVNEVRVIVDPGQRFAFSRAAITPVAPRTELPDGYATGKPAGTGVIRSAALAGIDGWRSFGHAKADMADQQITADHASATVDSRIALDPGPAVTFGQLHISGQNRMKMRRLVKIAGFPEGERFDPEKIEDVRVRLRRTEVFSAITLEEAETLRQPGDVLDMTLTVVEQKPRQLGAGFEISTTDGMMVTAYWMHRNLLGGGERLRIGGTVTDINADNSGRDDELSLRIDRPATITPDTTAYVLLRGEREREEDYDSDIAGVSLGFNHIFNNDLSADIAVQYQVSRVNDANGRTDFKVLALPSNVLWDKRDEPNNARSGFYLRGDVVPFYGFSGTGSGAQVLGEGRSYYTLGESERFTLAARARLGSVLGTSIEETPRDYLFFSGGGGSVRGHPYQSLGVEAIPGPDGPIRTGGMSIATLNAELRFQVRERIGLVLFADYGELWEEDSWSGGSNSHSGAGVGIRYDTPVGPLRFDVAGPTSGSSGDGMQIYLGLGQSF